MATQLTYAWPSVFWFMSIAQVYEFFVLIGPGIEKYFQTFYPSKKDIILANNIQPCYIQLW
jgi:hypothetical protein